MRLAALVFLVGCGLGGRDGRPDRHRGPNGIDADGDGFGLADDCDDADPLVHPGAEDPAYDGLDADCAGDSDFDADRDGEDSDQHGGTDCDDADPLVSTAATELCNAIDDDCDGESDEDAADAQSWWLDEDLDGYGDPATLFTTCTPPAEGVAVGDDCDDEDPMTYPTAADIVCDGRDNDCDPATSEPGVVTLDGSPVPDLAAALAEAGQGGEIELCEGRYAGQGLEIRDGVVLRGLGSAVTFVDGGGVTPALRVSTNAPVTLEGISLTGGLGAGLVLDRDATVEGVDLLVTGNYAPSGGGLFADQGARLTLRSSWISGNTAESCAGALLERDVVVSGDGASGFDGNSALSGAGGGLCAKPGAVLSDLLVTHNHAVGASGGIDGDSIVLDGVTLTGNTTALDGGAMTVHGEVEITSCTITDNVADVDAGGIRAFFPGTVVTIRDSVVTGNEALFAFASAGGVQLAQGAALESFDTDWGTGAADNTPHDVALVLANGTWDWGGTASFQCTDGVGGSCL